MTDTCRIFSYSPNNTKANAYYQACNKFDDIRNKVIAYEHKTSDRESSEYKSMMKEFDYWNKMVPETSNIAAKFEDKLLQKELAKNQNIPGKEIGFPVKERHIDYMA